jgi:hypothetical protein
MKKSIYCLFLGLCLAFGVHAQNNPDTFRIRVNNRHWKTGAPVKLDYDQYTFSWMPGVIGYSLDSSGFGADVLFSSVDSAAGFCPRIGRFTDDAINGVTVADLITLSRIILGLESNPVIPQRLAGDVNRSASLTTFDIVEMRKLLLNIYTQFPTMAFWIGVTSYSQTNNGISGIECPDYIPNTSAAVDTVDLLVSKAGDLDGDANPNGPYMIPQTFSSAISSPRTSAQAGDTVLVPIHVTPGTVLSGIQMGLSLDTALIKFIGFEVSGNPGLGITQSNFGVFTDKITFAAYQVDSGTTCTNDPLFFLRFIAKQNFSNQLLLHLAQNLPLPLWTDGQFAVHPLDTILGITAVKTAPQNALRVSAPSPNPFRERSFLTVELEHSSQATLYLFDGMGRRLRQTQYTLTAGSNVVEIPGNVCPANGMVFYRLVGDDWVAAGKVWRL